MPDTDAALAAEFPDVLAALEVAAAELRAATEADGDRIWSLVLAGARTRNLPARRSERR